MEKDTNCKYYISKFMFCILYGIAVAGMGNNNITPIRMTIGFVVLITIQINRIYYNKSRVLYGGLPKHIRITELFTAVFVIVGAVVAWI